MLNVRLAAVTSSVPAVLAVPVDAGGPIRSAVLADEALVAQAAAFAAQAGHTGAAGSVESLPRPGQRPHRLLLVGVGDGDEAGWRSAGAALHRAAARETSLRIALPAGSAPSALRGLAEGLLLAAYRFRLGAPTDRTPQLHRVTVLVDAAERYEAALATATAVAAATYLARDLTNMPSEEKSPAWFAARVAREATRSPGLKLRVRGPRELAAEGFGGILAVGGGSPRGPRLVELEWRPRGAGRHIALVGKGITFDSGGISIKPRDGMKLMRKDMSGAAAIIAATLGAAQLRLPVRVTALAPLADNMPSGSSYRPGDVVRHYGGRTTEVLDTDAEGRIVLADALAYAARRLRPDLLVDLATLTGANAVALGKRTAALYSDNDALAADLAAAATAAGEKVWRLPLQDDYLETFASDVADSANVGSGGAGSITAALFLREFTGTARDRWAHVDFSAPSWIEGSEGELVKGATGWGVRTLLRWLEQLGA